MERIVPIGKGERLDLKKKIDIVAASADELQEVVTLATQARRKIIEAHAREMAKPEWARRKSVLEKLELDFAENDAQLDALRKISADLEKSVDYIRVRDLELERRGKEEGY